MAIPPVTLLVEFVRSVVHRESQAVPMRISRRYGMPPRQFVVFFMIEFLD
jgi:hypothetical protein